MSALKPVLLAIALAASTLSTAGIAIADVPSLSATDQAEAQKLAAGIEKVVADAPHDAPQSVIQLRIREIIRRSGQRASVVLAALNLAEDAVINQPDGPSFGLAALQSIDTRLTSLVGSNAPAAAGSGSGSAALGGPIVGIGGGGSNYKP